MWTVFVLYSSRILSVHQVCQLSKLSSQMVRPPGQLESKVGNDKEGEAENP